MLITICDCCLDTLSLDLQLLFVELCKLSLVRGGIFEVPVSHTRDWMICALALKDLEEAGFILTYEHGNDVLLIRCQGIEAIDKGCYVFCLNEA